MRHFIKGFKTGLIFDLQKVGYPKIYYIGHTIGRYTRRLKK